MAGRTASRRQTGRPAQQRPQRKTKRQPVRSSSRKHSAIWNDGAFDVPFLAIVLTLITFGLIMLFSASYVYSYYNQDGDSLYYFKRQLIFAIMGIVLMFVVSRVEYHVWQKVSIPLLVVSYGLLVLVLFVTPPAGYEDFHRWINLGFITFQPSEIAKFTLILFLAQHIGKNYPYITRKVPSQAGWTVNWNANHPRRLIQQKHTCFLLYAAVAASMCILVYKENHVSGTVILFALFFVMIWMAGYNKRAFLVIVALAAILVVVVVSKPEILPSHAQSRITAWLDKSYDPLGVRWQTNHALYAIGSGGFFGVGLGNSKMKQLYVSEPQNDFIFSIVCEELGFVGAMAVIALFVLLLWRGFMIGLHAKDKFGSLLAIGLSFQVGLQAALNIAVVTDMFPNTGISLPFFSYGGTSLVMLIVEMGIVLSISRSAAMKKLPEEKLPEEV